MTTILTAISSVELYIVHIGSGQHKWRLTYNSNLSLMM